MKLNDKETVTLGVALNGVHSMALCQRGRVAHAVCIAIQHKPNQSCLILIEPILFYIFCKVEHYILGTAMKSIQNRPYFLIFFIVVSNP
jgi:hypothetical protein